MNKYPDAWRITGPKVWRIQPDGRVFPDFDHEHRKQRERDVAAIRAKFSQLKLDTRKYFR